MARFRIASIVTIDRSMNTPNDTRAICGAFPMPNQRMKSGMSENRGTGRMRSTVVSKKSLACRLKPKSRPAVMPSVPPTNSPPRIICIETTNAPRSSALIVQKTFAIRNGEGRKTLRTSVSSVTPTHTKKAIVGMARVLRMRGGTQRRLDPGPGAGAVSVTWRSSSDTAKSSHVANHRETPVPVRRKSSTSVLCSEGQSVSPNALFMPCALPPPVMR